MPGPGLLPQPEEDLLVGSHLISEGDRVRSSRHTGPSARPTQLTMLSVVGAGSQLGSPAKSDREEPCFLGMRGDSE